MGRNGKILEKTKSFLGTGPHFDLYKVKFNLKQLRLDLQLFAGDPDKTEKATPRRKEKAREEGQVTYSKDLAMAMVFMAVLVVLKSIFPRTYVAIKNMTEYFVSLPTSGDYKEISELHAIIIPQLNDVFTTLATVLLAAFAIAIGLGLMQTKGMFVLKNAMKFDLNRINPLSGLKRMFSLKSVVELIKNLAKLAILGFVGYNFIVGVWNTLFLLPSYSISDSMAFIGNSLYDMSFQIAFALLILGFADFFYQKWEFERSIKMSKQEIKDEYKNIEGNPEIKRRQKQMMAEVASKKMIEEIPSATVVVTNPTHFAVALRFELGDMTAPLVVAKGADLMAQKIKEIATEYKIPIFENAPLTRRLYAEVDIGEEVPTDMYQAVAEVLAYVFKASGKV